MQDGQLCLLSPGGKWWTYSILREEKQKGGKKLVGLSVGHLGWRRGGRGPESIALFFLTVEAELKYSIDIIEIYHESPGRRGYFILKGHSNSYSIPGK